MSTLRQAYDKQESKDGIKRVNTFLVPVEQFYVEEGFNVRDLDAEHIESIRSSFEAGSYIPPILVRVTERGLKIIDGHHRYRAAVLAGVSRLEAKDFEGDEKDMVAAMITSSQGKNLTPLERARAYQRLKVFGLTADEIAKKVNRSRPDVENHLALMSAPEEVIKAVQAGEIGFATAVSALRNHGMNAGSVVTEAVKKAKSEGKSKVTGQALKSFGKADYDRAMNLLAIMDQSVLPNELAELVQKFLASKNKGGAA